MRYYPAFLDLHDKFCCVIGGGAIAGRLGEFDDIKRLETENASDSMRIETLIGSGYRFRSQP